MINTFATWVFFLAAPGAFLFPAVLARTHGHHLALAIGAANLLLPPLTLAAAGRIYAAIVWSGVLISALALPPPAAPAPLPAPWRVKLTLACGVSLAIWISNYGWIWIGAFVAGLTGAAH